MKKYFFYILMCFFNVSICSSQNIPHFSFDNVVSKPKEIIKHYGKIDINTISDDAKYKLALAYYFLAMNKKHGKEKKFSKAINLFKQLENNKKYKVNSLFREGLCNTGLNKYESAYKNFSDLISINPLIPEAYYFEASSFYYLKHYSHLTQNDTLEYFHLVNEMDLIIQITSDTNKLKLLAEATYNLQNILKEYPVFGGDSPEKTTGLIDENKYYYPMEVSNLYELDSLPPPIINKSIYELYATLQLCYFNISTDSFAYKTIPFEKLLKTDNINSLLNIPDSLPIDSFQLTIQKFTDSYKIVKDTLIIDGDPKVVTFQSYSSVLTNKMLEALKELTIDDKIDFENIFTAKTKQGFITPAWGRLRIIN